MSNTIRYTLGKAERLKSRKQIDELFKKGRSFSIFPFRVVYTIENADDLLLNKNLLQAGFSASSKNFKKAIHRNRIKRLMREAYRLQKNMLEDRMKLKGRKLAVFFLYTGNEVPDHSLVFSKIGKALQQLQKITDENIIADK